MSDSHEHPPANEPDALDSLRRRDFLTILGASFATLGLSGCDFNAPTQKVIPYLQQPEGITPGVASWYGSTCTGCPAGCGALVKNRDGRPIKLEGNPDHPLSQGGLCARGQATVLDLYDSQRLRGPMAGETETTWDAADAAIVGELRAAAAAGQGIRILSRTVNSPSVLAAIDRFLAAYPAARHVQYDPLSVSAILEAHRLTRGVARLPWYRFDKARVIVSFDADFLGSWISPVEFTRAWSVNRSVDEKRREMSRHVQFEPRMSLTGANADVRVPLKPSDELPTVLTLARRVGQRLSRPEAERLPLASAELAVEEATLDRVVEDLVAARGRSLVVSGSNDVNVQVAVNAMNHMLGNDGATVDLAQPSLQLAARDAEMNELIDEMNAGEVGALILYDANPAHDHPRAAEFRAAMQNAGLTVSLAGLRDETAALARYVCPDHHGLEMWGDRHPHVGIFGLIQPTIAPLFNTRAAVESLTAWAGSPAAAHDWLRTVWRDRVFPLQTAEREFEPFWEASVRAGAIAVESERLNVPEFDVRSFASIQDQPEPSAGEGLEFVAYASVALGDGRQANNPWLQELPDPVTKAAWGNYASMAPAEAERLGAIEGRVVEIVSGETSVQLPAHIQPGMPEGVVACALGYGRAGAGAIAANYPMQKMFPVEKDLLAGADVYPLMRAGRVQLRLTARMDPLAKTQIYDYQAVPFTAAHREAVRETTLADYAQDPHAGNHKGHEGPNLWPGHEYPGHKWALAIDLNKCTGCSACVVGCQAENNVPIVGKAEVRKSRDMQWIRIDRYYSGSPERTDAEPEVVFQPMLCQHCDNAPCETVCPVLATVHGEEGLNMQVYNRCVGTRYCANNCPYKVRRFNWFDYAHNDLVQNLVLNPDVAVRTRGVMEKCSMCAQRIYEGKRAAKAEGREPADGEIQPACAQSCPAQAIIFGDVNSARSAVARAAGDPRSYTVLAEVGVGPNVHYLTKVRNKPVTDT